MKDEIVSNDFLIRTIQRVVNEFKSFKFDAWELINEVWLRGRIQKITNIKYLTKRIRYDILDVIRDMNETRRKHRLIFKSDDSLEEKFCSQENREISLVDQADSFDFITRNLSAKQKEIIYQTFWEGKNQYETASTLGISQPSVCWHLNNALDKIRKEQNDSKRYGN